ncbi:MAG: hypothetical protein GKS00_01350 [Alphaproteobacteria bacterium]|nr:hypothetical protein [Alphaproteobacteria bacterium]
MTDGLVEVPLREIAHGRTGDKGDRSNVSIIPYVPDAYAYIEEQVTEGRMRAAFGHRGASKVVRYDLPVLGAFNFVLDDVLQGGVNGSLNLDGHGKSLSFLALSVTVKVPQSVVENARQARQSDGAA